MSDQSMSFAESKYRRGTILGLTVAEIFILLLFLLMLIFLVLSQEQTQQLEQQQEELEQQEEELAQLTVFRETWERSLAGIERPEEIVALKRWRDDVMENSRSSDTERLLSQLVQAEQERDASESEREELEKENRRLLAESARQLEEIEEQRENLENIQRENQQFHALAEEQRILREKGQNPPCWYETIAAAGGGTREKALYLFDIAVFDEHMVVRQRPVPSGGAFDDSDRTYAEEATLLPLDEIRYGAPLGDSEVEDSLGPIFNAGKGARVRTYSCVFFVQVWDETSDFAKERWQQAHDRVLEGLFGTFTVRDEPWQPQ